MRYTVPFPCTLYATPNPTHSMTPRKSPITTGQPAPVMVRLSTVPRAELIRAAERAGKPLSTYIREAAIAQAKRDNRRAA